MDMKKFVESLSDSELESLKIAIHTKEMQNQNANKSIYGIQREQEEQRIKELNDISRQQHIPNPTNFIGYIRFR